MRYPQSLHDGLARIKTKTAAIITILTVATFGIGLGLAGSAITSASSGSTLYVGHGATGTNKSCNSPGYNSVQTAVNAASSGNTVYLCGGQFAQQVFVKKSVTLTGDAGSGLTATGTTFSSNAADYPPVFTTGGLFLPQALLVTTGNNVTVNGLKVSGPLPGNGGCAEDEYGVLALDGHITLKNDLVANVADVNPSLNGCQFGVGVQIGRTYWHKADFSYATPNPDFTASADIDGTTVSGYAKNGITVDGSGSSADIDSSIVVGGGNGQVAAQNGIQFSRGATGSATNNTVSDNAYNGPGQSTAAGILVYGGFGDPLSKNVVVQNNKLIGNDEGINFAEYNADATDAATSPTRNVAKDNWIYNGKVTNTTGLVASNGNYGYQAGLEDVGNGDSACNNTIIGPGYTDQGSYDATTSTATPGPDNAVVRDVDAGYTFPTTAFSTCNGGGYGGSHFNQNFFKFYHNRKWGHRWDFQ